MIKRNSKLIAVSAALTVLGVACGTVPSGPSEMNQAFSTPAVATGGQSTISGTSYQLAPTCDVKQTSLYVAHVDKDSVLVGSDYAASKVCPSLTWTLAPSGKLVPGVDEKGLDTATVSGGKRRIRSAAAYTVRAFGPNGVSAEIVVEIP